MINDPKIYKNLSLYGSAGEALVIADLLAHRYDVFIGFGLTSCDLIALKNNKLSRIEVKSKLKKTIPYLPSYDKTKSDYLALVNLETHKIEFIPRLYDFEGR